MTRSSRQRGVTLVELLVVLSILAFAATLVALNTPPARSGARDEAERFAARLRAAREDSVIHATPVAVALTARGYRIERYVNSEWRSEAPSRRFSERSLPSGVTMTASLADAAAANEPDVESLREDVKRIVLDPIGVTNPFTVEFADRRERWRVIRGDNETIELERVGR